MDNTLTPTQSVGPQQVYPPIPLEPVREFDSAS